MDEKIKGLYIYARDGTETFKIKFIGSMAFGVVDEDTTDKRFLELYCPEYENQIKQLQAENKSLKMDINRFEIRWKELIQQCNEYIDSNKQKNEQLQAENERMREALKEIQKYESDNFRTGIGYDRKVADIVHGALKETK